LLKPRETQEARTTGQHSSPSVQQAPSQSAQAGQGQNHRENVLTVNKLKQDLENAGFSDVKILADSFVVQAKDKDGNPTVMSLSPGGVVAFSELNQQRQTKASNTRSNSGGSETERR
jgi:hypothetical protein